MSSSSNTTIVNVDADIVITLNDFFSRLFIGNESNTFAADCKLLLEQNQFDQLSKKYIENIDHIFGLDNERGNFQ